MDDEAQVLVFEAIIAGVLVLTAILFMTGLSAPSASESTGGLDLGRIAADTLEILQGRDADCDEDNQPVAGCTVYFENRLEELVDEAMRGDTTASHTFIQNVLPSGTRYLLRLDNGVEPLTLLPAGSGPATNPRAAQASEVFLMPDWDAFAAAPGDPDPATLFVRPGAETYSTGAAFDLTVWTTLTAPNGVTTAPDGTSWRAWWGNEAGTDRVPATIPYGVWDLDGTKLRVHGDAMTDHPLYAVQLLVWAGA